MSSLEEGELHSRVESRDLIEIRNRIGRFMACPLSVPDLARATGVDDQTIRNAESGQALSEALGRLIQVRDRDGL